MGDRDDARSGRVYVGGLTETIKKEDLEGEFEKYGKLNSVWVAFNPPGFAFVEFNSHDDAETACDNLNGTDFLGTKLRVEIARGRSRRGPPQSFRGDGHRGRYDGYRGGSRRDDGPRYQSRDYGRRGDGYAPRGDSYGGRGGGGGRRYDGGQRYRSRSPVGAAARH